MDYIEVVADQTREGDSVGGKIDGVGKGAHSQGRGPVRKGWD
jgi:hypothetical protein